MTVNTYLWCLAAGLLGILLFIFTKRVPAMKERYRVANENFTVSQYLKDDSTGIFSSLIAVAIALVLIDEFIIVYPKVTPFLKGGFVFVGYTGVSYLVGILGKAQDKLNKVIDAKTDLADSVVNKDDVVPK